MGYINKDELSNELLEYMEGLGLTEEQVNQIVADALVDINEKNVNQDEAITAAQPKTDENLVTNDKTIVGAINELFQSANNGKELIANAIGEPVSAEDTFSAMSNDINGLLATFKTNMMNNGVTVESGDKFKSLIDKIATLADNEGKGIQYLEGIIDINLTTIEDEWVSKTINFNDIGLTFNPTYLFIRPTSFNIDNSEITSILCNAYNNSENNVVFLMMRDNTIINGYCYMTSTSESFTLFVHRTIGWTSNDEIVGIIPGIQYYAIGVGEEDNTLLDSLKSILENKGVDVTEEDDMASLITKVDDLQVSDYLPTEGYDYNLAFVNKQTVTGDTYTTVLEKTIPKGISTVRLELFLQSGTSTSVKAYCYVTHSRNGSELYSNEYSSSSYGSYQEKGNTFEVLEGDVIKVQLKGGNSTGIAIIANVSLSVGVEIK